MSAAAAPSIPPQIPTKFKAYCKTPLSMFERLLDLDNYTQLRLFCLVLVETVGHYAGGQSGRQWAEISTDQAKESANVSTEAISDAWYSLIDEYKLIRSRKNNAGRREYALNEGFINEANGKKIRGVCPDCKEEGLFSTEYIPVLHMVLRKLGACVDPATFKVTMVIIRYTWKANREQGLYVEPYELKLDDFVRLTGLEKREVTNGLSKAKSYGIVNRRTLGIRSWYWAVPETIAGLEKRGPRLVSPPKPKDEGKANPNPPNSGTNPKNTGKTHATEARFVSGYRCPNCKHFVTPEPVSDGKTAASTENPAATEQRPTARAGPGREMGAWKSKTDAAFDRLRRKYASE